MEDKFYLTKQGIEKIKQEYKELLLTKQEKMRTGAPVAFHSEELDTEFVAFKEDLELIEAREADLEYILKNSVLIEKPTTEEQNQVGLGAKVLVDVDGETDEFILVGTLEANPIEGKISNESPIGKALFGKKVGDIIQLNSPVAVNYKIKRINY
ncbi:MAG: GreA/GreB family elongation factor [Candidatus Pacebacteria bacterium]|nr:GreA/GreB family elongation factor [Candidatus Paceibacterota bacterium]